MIQPQSSPDAKSSAFFASGAPDLAAWEFRHAWHARDRVTVFRETDLCHRTRLESITGSRYRFRRTRLFGLSRGVQTPYAGRAARTPAVLGARRRPGVAACSERLAVVQVMSALPPVRRMHGRGRRRELSQPPTTPKAELGGRVFVSWLAARQRYVTGRGEGRELRNGRAAARS